MVLGYYHVNTICSRNLTRQSSSELYGYFVLGKPCYEMHPDLCDIYSTAEAMKDGKSRDEKTRTWLANKAEQLHGHMYNHKKNFFPNHFEVNYHSITMH